MQTVLMSLEFFQISAKESRQRKKEYIDGLEERVERCTKTNQTLQAKVFDLEKQNESLLKQLRRLQQMVSRFNPTVTQAGTCVMVSVNMQYTMTLL